MSHVTRKRKHAHVHVGGTWAPWADLAACSRGFLVGGTPPMSSDDVASENPPAKEDIERVCTEHRSRHASRWRGGPTGERMRALPRACTHVAAPDAARCRPPQCGGAGASGTCTRSIGAPVIGL